MSVPDEDARISVNSANSKRAIGEAWAGNVLYAFYDLEICSVSFDFLNWLLRAETARLEAGATAMHVVFVPGCDDGFSSFHLSVDVKKWRLSSILVAACNLIPAITGVTVCYSRNQAAALEMRHRASMFPLGYTVRLYDSEAAYGLAWHSAVDVWLLGGLLVRHLRGDEIPTLRPSEKAKRFVQDWIAKHAAGKKVIALTLRESHHAKFRNANIDDWLRFAAQLDSDRYLAVIVRDTDQIFQSPGSFAEFLTFPEAALDLEIRLAFYEAAYLNLLVNNGPLAACYLNPKIRFLAYRFFENTDEEGTVPYTELYGIPCGGQLPISNEFQRIVWENDTYDVLHTSFTEMADQIERADANGTLASKLVRGSVGIEDYMSIAVALHSANQLRHAEAIYALVLEQKPKYAAAKGMLGLVCYHEHRYHEAVDLLEAAIAIDNGDPSHHFNLGNVYEALGRDGDARASFERAIDLNRDRWSGYANLAANLVSGDELDDAQIQYHEALARGGRDAQTLLEYAVVLRRLDHTMASVKVFKLLAEHFERRSARRRDMSNRERPDLATVHSSRHRRFVFPGRRNLSSFHES
jgi:tetratricopeptide (TPR) repeat protein